MVRLRAWCRRLARATISPESSSAPKARSASLPRAVLRIVRRPEAVQTLLACFNEYRSCAVYQRRRPREEWLPSAMEMMDRISISACRSPLSMQAIPTAGPPPRSSWTAQPPSLRPNGTQVLPRDLRAQRRMGTTPCPARKRRSSGRGLTAFAAMGRVSPNYIVQDSRNPPHQTPRSARPDAAPQQQGPACALPMSSTPATATCAMVLYSSAIG